MKKLITIVLSMFLFSQGLYSQPDGWSPIPNESSGGFMGQATIDAVPAVEGDWSAAFTQDGICAGAAILMIIAPAPAQFPSSSNAADQSPSSAGTASMVACPINPPEDSLGIGLQSSGC